MDQDLQIDDPLFKEKGFGRRIGFGRHCALIVVDMIRGFTDPAQPLGADLEQAVLATNRLVAACRRIDASIHFFTVGYRADLSDAGVWQKKMGGMASLMEGSDNVRLDPRLDTVDGDSIMSKKYASCFAGTDLAARLVSQGVDTVIVTGCTTSGCVRATVVDAVQSGFRPIIAPEAVGDRSGAAHRQSLLDMDAKYGDVVPLDEVIAHLARIAQPVEA